MAMPGDYFLIKNVEENKDLRRLQSVIQINAPPVIRFHISV